MTMRYLGSKNSTARALLGIVSDRIPSGSFCDPFGGIGVVGAMFKRHGYDVFACDILRNAYNFQVARIELTHPPNFSRLRQFLNLHGPLEVVQRLNSAKQYAGWFEREYAIKRRFFTRDNARKIGGCRRLIYQWDRDELLTPPERAILLASLVSSMDKNANTAGTYYAYLKTWYRKALRPFRFELLKPTRGSRNCGVENCAAEDFVADRAFDVLYLDPPYNKRNYAGYYHLPETIARQATPKVSGVAGVPQCDPLQLSDFNRPSAARDALARLLSKACFRLLLFHYADDGLIPRHEIRRLLRPLGTLSEHVLGARGYSTGDDARTIYQRVYVVSK